MKIFEQRQDREVYLNTQVERSRVKFGYCNTSINDTVRYRKLLRDAGPLPGPILCLGTRNGREIDVFRTAFFGSRFWTMLSRVAEIKGNVSRLPFLESFGRSRWDKITDSSVVGVEVNPDAERSDVWTGSFDDMPLGWKGRFGLIYSNSLDHAFDIERTTAEWLRVARPGAYFIICYAPGTEPSLTDPIGDIRKADILNLFGGEEIFFRERGSRSGYSELILRLS